MGWNEAWPKHLQIPAAETVGSHALDHALSAVVNHEIIAGSAGFGYYEPSVAYFPDISNMNICFGETANAPILA